MFKYLLLGVLVAGIVAALWVLLGPSFMDAVNVVNEHLG